MSNRWFSIQLLKFPELHSYYEMLWKRWKTKIFIHCSDTHQQSLLKTFSGFLPQDFVVICLQKKTKKFLQYTDKEIAKLQSMIKVTETFFGP